MTVYHFHLIKFIIFLFSMLKVYHVKNCDTGYVILYIYVVPKKLWVLTCVPLRTWLLGVTIFKLAYLTWILGTSQLTLKKWSDFNSHRERERERERERQRHDGGRGGGGGIVKVAPKPNKGLSSKVIDFVEKVMVKFMYQNNHSSLPHHHLSGSFTPVFEETPPTTNLLVKGHLPVSTTVLCTLL